MGLGAQAKGGQGSAVRDEHRGRLLAWQARPLALLGAERRHARGQVRRGAAASAWVVMQGSGGVDGRKGKAGERDRFVSR